MFDQQSMFFQRSKEIAERFLQTIVIIDDQAYFGKTTPISDIQQNYIDDEKENTKSDSESKGSAKRARGITESLTIPSDERKGPTHDLDAQKVMNSFARKKIICSVINPTLDSDLTDTFKNLATSADVIVVDWDLKKNEQNGETALDILEHISQSAVETPSQLRLFIIYTGDPDIVGIADKIKGNLLNRLDTNIKEDDDGFTLSFKSVRIGVLAKPSTSIPEQYQDRQVSFDELPDRVIIEFTKMTAGLVSNVAVEAMTCLRQNTFRILGRFTQDLDTPYLTHRFLQSLPSDVEDHIVSLIAAEFYAIMNEVEVGTEAGTEAIGHWLDAYGIEEIEPISPKKLTKAHLNQLADTGINHLPNEILNKDQKKKLHKSLTKSLLKSASDTIHDAQFAVLTNMRSFYENSHRCLTLGTILKTIGDANSSEITPSYFLCLQPVCDTVRLSHDEQRAFPFIPLDVINDDNGKFSIVVSETSSGATRLVRLMPKTKSYYLKIIEFKPRHQDSDRIKTDDLYRFMDTSSNFYEWVGELRSEHGLRSLQQFANTMSRVGLNESEWLRLSAGKAQSIE